MKKILILMMALWASQASAQLLHGVTDSLSGGGTPTPPAGNCIQADVGNDLLADTGNCILVQ